MRIFSPKRYVASVDRIDLDTLWADGSGNLLGITRHQGVIAVEQNGALAVGPKGIEVDAVDRGNISFGAENPHV